MVGDDVKMDGFVDAFDYNYGNKITQNLTFNLEADAMVEADLQGTLGRKHVSEKLVEETDYIIVYADNINAGTATISITGIGNYDGVISKIFVINKINPTINPTIKYRSEDSEKQYYYATQTLEDVLVDLGEPHTAGNLNWLHDVTENFGGKELANHTTVTKNYRFVPEDTTNYNIVSGSLSFEVEPRYLVRIEIKDVEKTEYDAYDLFNPNITVIGHFNDEDKDKYKDDSIEATGEVLEYQNEYFINRVDGYAWAGENARVQVTDTKFVVVTSLNSSIKEEYNITVKPIQIKVTLNSAPYLVQYDERGMIVETSIGYTTDTADVNMRDRWNDYGKGVTINYIKYGRGEAQAGYTSEGWYLLELSSNNKNFAFADEDSKVKVNVKLPKIYHQTSDYYVEVESEQGFDEGFGVYLEFLGDLDANDIKYYVGKFDVNIAELIIVHFTKDGEEVVFSGTYNLTFSVDPLIRDNAGLKIYTKDDAKSDFDENPLDAESYRKIGDNQITIDNISSTVILLSTTPRASSASIWIYIGVGIGILLIVALAIIINRVNAAKRKRMRFLAGKNDDDDEEEEEAQAVDSESADSKAKEQPSKANKKSK